MPGILCQCAHSEYMYGVVPYHPQVNGITLIRPLLGDKQGLCESQLA